MKAYLIILIILGYCGFTSHRNTSIDKVKDKIYNRIQKRISNSSWSISQNNDEIKLTFIDTFFINTSISPLNNRDGYYNKLDTLSIKIKFEDNWSQFKIDSIKISNKEKLEPLKNKFIHYYDSLDWIGIKSNREMFLDEPYTYLKRWEGLSESERKTFNEIIILPDKLIHNIGIYVKSDYNPPYMMIESVNANRRFFNVYDSFTDVLGESSLFKYEENN